MAKKRRVDEERARRNQQLEITRNAVATLQEKLRATRKNTNDCTALSSHLSGFYQEIDKLAKGKTLVPVTDLVVQQANEIISDAKAFITGDIYLDRLKTFVPAGDNPVYPDVLLGMRTIRQSLERAQTNSNGLQREVQNLLSEATTISAALEFFIEQGNSPLKENVEDILEGSAVSGAWFYEAEDGEEYFDFERLDRYNLEGYLQGNEGKLKPREAEGTESDSEDDVSPAREENPEDAEA